MRHNLPGIMSRLFNTPLMIRPDAAQTIIAAVSGRMGIGSLLDASTGERIDLSGQVAARGGASDAPVRRSYALVDGIAVLPVSGTLAHKWGALYPECGATGYDGIQARLMSAIADPDVKGIMLDMNTPGGEVAGAFDCTDIIARLSQQKPIWSLCYDMHASAGQLIAAGTNRRLITQTGVAGSIGVVMAHMDMSGQLEQMGRTVTLIHAGSHKVDANPYEALPDSVRADLQAGVEQTRLRFAETVARYTGVSVESVLAQEAACFEGQAAIDAGLADELVNGADAVAVMAERLSHKPIFTTGSRMEVTDLPVNGETNNGQHAETNKTEPLATVNENTDMAAVTAERTRIMGILGLAEAKGREATAQALASNPGMTIDAAKAVLSTIPLSAQAATETALDALMEHSPAAVTAKGDNQPTKHGVDMKKVARLTKSKK